MIFRQLLDPDTSTWTYLLADARTREGVLIDPVREQLARDVEILNELDVSLVGVLETHVHADHVTSGGLLRERFGCRLFVGERAGVLTADVQLKDADVVRFGRHELEAISTPGHTNGCITYVCHEERLAFTGDALLIRGCGRTDFQQGDAATLFRSVRERILTLPGDTRLYPGHDYRGRTVTTVEEERRFNRRLAESKTVEQFVETMAKLDLAYPRRIDEAVPANMASGLTEPEEAHPSCAARDQWAPIARTGTGVPVVEAEWVEEHLDEVHVIDVREHMEFCGPLGHIAGAELIPLSQLQRALRFRNRNESFILVCTYGTRSGRATQLLAEEGFGRVASLHGGLVRWIEEGRPRVEVLGDRPREEASMWEGMGI